MSLHRVLTWFSLIGVANAGIDLVAFNLLLAIWPNRTTYGLIVINSLAYTLAVSNSYYWNSRITFKNQSTHSANEKLMFVIQAVGSLVINNLVFILFVEILRHLDLQPFVTQNLAKLMPMLVSSTCSFILMRRLVFTGSRNVN